MQVSASFAEADATKLKVGQTATVTWAALTGATATGKVATIAPTATTANNVNSYAVVVSLGLGARRCPHRTDGHREGHRRPGATASCGCRTRRYARSAPGTR